VQIWCIENAFVLESIFVGVAHRVRVVSAWKIKLIRGVSDVSQRIHLRFKSHQAGASFDDTLPPFVVARTVDTDIDSTLETFCGDCYPQSPNFSDKGDSKPIERSNSGIQSLTRTVFRIEGEKLRKYFKKSLKRRNQ
jgi:hypothetical protein